MLIGTSLAGRSSRAAAIASQAQLAVVAKTARGSSIDFVAMRFENTVTIGRSPADVFAYLADFENVPTWNYAIVETRKLSEDPVGVGTKYRQVRQLPRPIEESFEITEFEPNARLSVEGTFGPFPGRFSYLLEPVAQGTRVTNVVELQPSGVLKLVGGLATARLRSAVGANLDKLKEILEKGS
jgi:uncharacterized protein YndB with AHSA1/START domain